MHVELTRSGGFAGLTRRVVVEGADLTPDERAGIDTLTGATAPGPAPEVGRDRYSYRLVVVDGTVERTYAFPEAAVPDVLQPLLRRLTEAAPRRPGRDL